MPLYEFYCPEHGEYTILVSGDTPTGCPDCGKQGEKKISAPARIIINNKERLRYGNGSPGKMILGSETGGLDIIVPSEGAMEQEEVDYVAEIAVEKERERIKNRPRSATREAISGLKELAYQTKPGERVDVLERAIKDSNLGHKVKLAKGG